MDHTEHGEMQPSRIQAEGNDSGNESKHGSISALHSRLGRTMEKCGTETSESAPLEPCPSAGQSTQERPSALHDTSQANFPVTGSSNKRTVVLGVLMEALRRDAMRQADDCKDINDADSVSSDNSVNSDDELERWAQQIRGEIRDSEMVELALEAEKAADAGQEHFAGHPSTFGDDTDAESSSSRRVGPVQRNRSYTDGPMLRRSVVRMRSENKKKLRVLALRNVTEVIPQMEEIHSHLGFHMFQNGIATVSASNNAELDFKAKPFAKPKISPRMGFLHNITSWVSSKNSRDDGATSPSEHIKSLLDRDDDENSISSRTDYEVGDTLAEQFHKKESDGGVKIRHVRVPSGLVFPDDEDFSEFLFGKVRTDEGTLGTAPTSSSSDVGHPFSEITGTMTLPYEAGKRDASPQQAPIPFSVDFDTPAHPGDEATSLLIDCGESVNSGLQQKNLQLPHLCTTPVRSRDRKAFGGLQMSNLGIWHSRHEDFDLTPRSKLVRAESMGQAILKDELKLSPLKGDAAEDCLVNTLYQNGPFHQMLKPRSKSVGDLLDISIEKIEDEYGADLHFLTEPETTDNNIVSTTLLTSPAILLSKQVDNADSTLAETADSFLEPAFTSQGKMEASLTLIDINLNGDDYRSEDMLDFSIDTVNRQDRTVDMETLSDDEYLVEQQEQQDDAKVTSNDVELSIGAINTLRETINEWHCTPGSKLVRAESAGQAFLTDELKFSSLKDTAEGCLVNMSYQNGPLHHMLKPRSKSVGYLLDISLEKFEDENGTDFHFLTEPETIHDKIVSSTLMTSHVVSLPKQTDDTDSSLPDISDSVLASVYTSHSKIESRLALLDINPNGEHLRNADMVISSIDAVNRVDRTVNPWLLEVETGTQLDKYSSKQPGGTGDTANEVELSIDIENSLKQAVNTSPAVDAATRSVDEDLLKQQNHTEVKLMNPLYQWNIIEQAIENDAIAMPVFPCECGIIIAPTNSLDSIPGTPLNSGPFNYVQEGSIRERNMTPLRKVTSCPSLLDPLATEQLDLLTSPISAKGASDSPARGGCLSDHTQSFSAAAMDVLMRLSPKIKHNSNLRHHAVNMMTRVENDEFLNNYLYCSKKQDQKVQGKLEDRRFCFVPCGDARGAEPCVEFDSGCSSFSGVISAANFIFPTKAPTRDLLNLDPGTYPGGLQSETWFDAATERFDGAMERFVGSSREQSHIWNSFQAPSLKVKASNLSRVMPAKVEAPVRAGRIILLDGHTRSSPAESVEYGDEGNETQWQTIGNGGPGEDLRSLQESDRESIPDTSPELRRHWTLNPVSLSKSLSGELRTENVFTIE